MIASRHMQKLPFVNHGLILTGPQCQTWWQGTTHLNGKKPQLMMSINSTYADGIGIENITFNVYYKSDPYHQLFLSVKSCQVIVPV